MTDQVDDSRGRRCRRWWQFGMRGLLFLVLLVAIGLLVVRLKLKPYWRQQQTIALVERLGGSCQTTEVHDWWLSRVGSTHNVTQIDLADCDDPDAYLAAVADLPAVEVLMVGGLAFTNAHAERLHRTRSLRGLILDSTSVSEEGLAALRAALSEADVCVSQRRAIAALSKLGRMDSSAAGITPSPLLKDLGDAWYSEGRQFDAEWSFDDCDSAYVAAVAGLRTLRLANTHVSDFGLHYVKGLRQLEVLYLDNTRAGDTGLEHLRGLSRLQTLCLPGTGVTDVGLAHVAEISQLQWLDLADTEISDQGLHHLARLRQLQRLMLQSTNITDGGLIHLRGLNRLQRLDLHGTKVTDAGLAHLAGLTELEELVLFNTQVTDAGLKHLRGLTKLHRLWLDDTGVTEEAVAKLRQALPSCSISGP